MKRVHKLSWFQVVAYGSSSFLPLTFGIFPRTACEYAGIDAGWSVVGLLLIGLLVGFGQGLHLERFPMLMGTDIAVRVFGLWIGKAVGIFFWFVYVLFSALCVYVFVLTIKAFFPGTPRHILVIALCLVAMKGAWNGIESLARSASIIYPLSILGVSLLLFGIITQAEHFWMPHTVTSWPATFRGVYHLLPIYFGINAFTIINPYYQHRRNTSIWYPVICTFIAAIAILVCFWAVVLNIGWEGAARVTLPLSFTLQLVRLNSLIVERVGIFIIVFGTLFTVLFISNQIWAISAHGARILNLSDEKYKWFVIPVSILITLTAASIRSSQQAFDWIDTYLAPLSWAMLLGVPYLLWIVAVLRGIGTKRGHNRQEN